MVSPLISLGHGISRMQQLGRVWAVVGLCSGCGGGGDVASAQYWGAGVGTWMRAGTGLDILETGLVDCLELARIFPGSSGSGL